jgi:superoxide dismutase
MSHTTHQNSYMAKTQKATKSQEEGFLRVLQSAEVMEERRTVASVPSLSEQIGEADYHIIARYWG